MRSTASASPCETCPPTSTVDNVDGEHGCIPEQPQAAAEGNDLHPSQGRVGCASESQKPLIHAVEAGCRLALQWLEQLRVLFVKSLDAVPALADKEPTAHGSGSQGCCPAGWSQNAFPWMQIRALGGRPGEAVRALVWSFASFWRGCELAGIL
jgi:hypothetical protein